MDANGAFAFQGVAVRELIPLTFKHGQRRQSAALAPQAAASLEKLERLRALDRETDVGELPRREGFR